MIYRAVRVTKCAAKCDSELGRVRDVRQSDSDVLASDGGLSER